MNDKKKPNPIPDVRRNVPAQEQHIDESWRRIETNRDVTVSKGQPFTKDDPPPRPKNNGK